ncbi:MAG: indolepyruvate oxidoreductase subunit B [Alphaproteobacteria bacterium]|nr:indolepyruvate oxidoreductase subunit B [Alphaproteobacteria bacterium]
MTPTTILIAAMGGEGGQVLADWLVLAAEAEGLAVQATSIAGVAQRTGATTYYLEMTPWPKDGRTPVLALNPAAGEVDVLVATELLEAARAVQAGLATAQRTTLITSTHRVLAMGEKIAMGDGRVDGAMMLRACREGAKRALLFDAEALMAADSAALNALMLGAIAASGTLPIAAERYEEAIRERGVAVEANLAGFRVGLEATRGGDAAAVADIRLPDSVEQVVALALPRLVDYQDQDYAALYRRRIEACGDLPEAVLREVARHLALRMSYEDIARVAQAKLRPERLARIRHELGAEDATPVRIHEFLKPGIGELCDMLPGFLARPILALARSRGWIGRAHCGMEIETTAIGGYLALAALAKTRRLRRWTHRYAVEQELIEEWLHAVRGAAALSPALAMEVAGLARLIKGYGDTHRRGLGNYRLIMDRLVLAALAGRAEPELAPRIARAREAALADPEGRALERALAA